MPPSPSPLDVRVFGWFDHHAWGHWLIAWGVFAALLGAAFAPLATPGETTPDRRPLWLRFLATRTFFVVAVLLMFAAFRWPIWFAGELDNPDEAQWIAGALTLRDGGLPWKSLDCHTSGPLNPYTLLLTVPLGLPLNYVGVRVLTSLLQAVSVLALWGAARRFVPEWIARLAVLPAVNLWACRWFHDMAQYSSEQAPILCLAFAGWIGAVALTTRRARFRLPFFFLAGFLTTAALFAKPQALPLAFALWLLLVGAVWFGASPEDAAPTTSRDRRARTAALILGATTPFALFAAYLWLYGLYYQVQIFFWRSNLLYAGERSYALCDSPEVFFDLIDPIRGSTAAVLGTLAFGLLAAVPTWEAARRERSRQLGAWLLVVAAIVTIVSPGRMFRHYVHFLVLPLAWLSVVSLAGAQRHLLASATTPSRRLLPALAAAFLLVTTAWPAWQISQQKRPMAGDLAHWRERQVCTVSWHLRQLVSPGDRMVVWGWAPKYHGETGLAQGAREAHGAFIIGSGPLQSHYRDRLLFDLKRNCPRWFVDAVAPRQFGFQDRLLFGHESWPPMRDYIAANYEQVDEVDEVRIYRLRPATPATPAGSAP